MNETNQFLVVLTNDNYIRKINQTLDQRISLNIIIMVQQWCLKTCASLNNFHIYLDMLLKTMSSSKFIPIYAETNAPDFSLSKSICWHITLSMLWNEWHMYIRLLTDSYAYLNGFWFQKSTSVIQLMHIQPKQKVWKYSSTIEFYLCTIFFLPIFCLYL